MPAGRSVVAFECDDPAQAERRTLEAVLVLRLGVQPGAGHARLDHGVRAAYRLVEEREELLGGVVASGAPLPVEGEPGDRKFDAAMPSDPQGWLKQFLRSGLRDYLSQRHHDVTAYAEDLDNIGVIADEVGRQLDEGLAWARQPWPDVEHDERGMADVG